jgi:hypothetical protein
VPKAERDVQTWNGKLPTLAASAPSRNRDH